MTLSDLHPDELLWREACGTLSPDERADLNAHLQRCPACVTGAHRANGSGARARPVRGRSCDSRPPGGPGARRERATTGRCDSRWLASPARSRGRCPPVRGRDCCGSHSAGRSCPRASGRTRAAAHRSQGISAETIARQPAPEVGPELDLAATGPAGDIGAPPGDAQIARAVSPPRYRRSLPENHRSKSGPVRSRTLAYAASGRPAGTQHPAQATEVPLSRPTPSSRIQSPVRPIQAPARAVESAPPPPSQQPSAESAPAVVDPPPFRGAADPETRRAGEDSAAVGGREPGVRGPRPTIPGHPRRDRRASALWAVAARSARRAGARAHDVRALPRRRSLRRARGGGPSRSSAGSAAAGTVARGAVGVARALARAPRVGSRSSRAHALGDARRAVSACLALACWAAAAGGPSATDGLPNRLALRIAAPPAVVVAMAARLAPRLAALGVALDVAVSARGEHRTRSGAAAGQQPGSAAGAGLGERAGHRQRRAAPHSATVRARPHPHGPAHARCRRGGARADHLHHRALGGQPARLGAHRRAACRSTRSAQRDAARALLGRRLPGHASKQTALQVGVFGGARLVVVRRAAGRPGWARLVDRSDNRRRAGRARCVSSRRSRVPYHRRER